MQTALHSQSKKSTPYLVQSTSSTFQKVPHFVQRCHHDHTTQINGSKNRWNARSWDNVPDTSMRCLLCSPNSACTKSTWWPRSTSGWTQTQNQWAMHKIWLARRVWYATVTQTLRDSHRQEQKWWETANKMAPLPGLQWNQQSHRVLWFFLFCFVYPCLFIIFRSESWHCCFDSLLFDSYHCHTIDS